jgi:hypothetical protein
MFTTYFDVSGTRLDSDIISVAGFVSDGEQWLKFEGEWREVLEEFGVPYLHMREFAHFKGPFESWRGQEKKRREFLQRLSGILARRVRKNFCRSIRVRDFEALAPTFSLEQIFGSPLGLCGVTCVGAVRIWQEQFTDGELNALIFEDGDEDKSTLTRSLETYHNVNPVYRRKEEHVQFQAADWVAYENRNLSSDWIQRRDSWGQKNYRRSATLLYDRVPNDWGDIGASEIHEICERLLHTVAQGLKS